MRHHWSKPAVFSFVGVSIVLMGHSCHHLLASERDNLDKYQDLFSVRNKKTSH